MVFLRRPSRRNCSPLLSTLSVLKKRQFSLYHIFCLIFQNKIYSVLIPFKLRLTFDCWYTRRTINAFTLDCEYVTTPPDNPIDIIVLFQHNCSNNHIETRDIIDFTFTNCFGNLYFWF